MCCRLQQLGTGLTRRLIRHRRDEMWGAEMWCTAGFRRTRAGVFYTQIAGYGSRTNRIAHPDDGAGTNHLTQRSAGGGGSQWRPYAGDATCSSPLAPEREELALTVEKVVFGALGDSCRGSAQCRENSLSSWPSR